MRPMCVYRNGARPMLMAAFYIWHRSIIGQFIFSCWAEGKHG